MVKQETCLIMCEDKKRGENDKKETKKDNDHLHQERRKKTYNHLVVVEVLLLPCPQAGRFGLKPR
jgi:hypothetical protein